MIIYVKIIKLKLIKYKDKEIILKINWLLYSKNYIRILIKLNNYKKNKIDKD